MPVRVATFNCENLFSRSKILNLNDTPAQAAKASAALKAADQLKKILIKPSYTAADKTKIVDLIVQGKGFFTLEQDRGKLLSGRKVIASGARDFVGHIRFNRQEVSGTAMTNTGKVIKELKADILCVVEVENREMLGQFNSRILTTKKFGNHVVIDGNDDRGIDVGILSNKRVRNIRTHVEDKDGNTRIFSRDCPEYELILDDGKPLWVLCNHFKSKGFGLPADNDARRKKQAERVAQILSENFNLKTDFVVVAGDLNDTPTSAPLAPLFSMSDLHDVVATLPAGDRFTHIFGTDKSQLDHILVSTALNSRLKNVAIERRGMLKVPGHFPTVGTAGEEASDHAAVVAEFDF